jgi:TetR/AcrR family transcriptional regulator, copper-responsive repressor
MVQKEPSGVAKRRGRPRAYDPDAALAQVIDTFWKAGYAGTSLDDLVAATGMNRPSLYAAFGDKRDLYIRALTHYWDRTRPFAHDALTRDRPLREALQRFYARALSVYLAGESGPQGCFAISTATPEAVRDAKVRTTLVQGLGWLDQVLEARIRFAKDKGELPRTADPAALAMLASATLHTLALRSRAGTPRKALEAMVAQALDLICGPARSKS